MGFLFELLRYAFIAILIVVSVAAGIVLAFFAGLIFAVVYAFRPCPGWERWLPLGLAR